MTANDIAVSGTASGTASGGTLEASNFDGIGNTYTFDVEAASDGTVEVVIRKLAVTDGVGGNNMASDTHTVEVDTTLFGIASAVWRDPDESDNVLSDGDELTLTFNQDTDMAGSQTPLSRSELDAVFDFGGSLGANYTGMWSNARTLVITVTDSTGADAVIGNTISPFRGTAFIRSLDTTGGTAFSNPNSVGTNSTGHVFVGDTSSRNVQIFHPDGVYAGALVTQIPDPAAPDPAAPDVRMIPIFSRPAGIATNSTGYTFIADNGSNLVLIFDPSGVYAGVLDPPDDLTFREPAGVAIGKDDMIYVSDVEKNTRNDRDRRIVQIFNPDGTYEGLLTTSVSTEFDVPLAVATNSSGHVFVADSGNDNIRIFDSDGEENTSNIDTTGPARSTLRAVATNSTDHLFVVYNNNADVDTVQVYTASGVYAGDQSFGDDVGLETISGIAVGSDDKIIVSERANNGVHIFGHQVLYSDTGVEQFQFPISTSGNFGELRATVSISSDDVADGATTGLGTIHFTAVFSEAVTDFVETSDITVGGTATATVIAPSAVVPPGDGTTYTFDVDVTAAGTLTVSIPAGAALASSNNPGNAASDVYAVTVIDTMPVVTSVYADNDAYMAGETIDITVTFDDAVTVDGTPQLTLETGVDDDDDAVVDYSSGTDTTELVFQYTVGATHNSDDLNYVGTDSLKLNEGTIVARDYNNPASLALPAVDSDESLGGRDVIVDTIAPIFSSATGINNNQSVEIILNEPVIGSIVHSHFNVTGSLVGSFSRVVEPNILLQLGLALVNASHTVSYTGESPVTDAAGNRVAAFDPQPIINNLFETVRPVPAITSVVVHGETTTFSTIIYFVDFGEGVIDFTKSDIVLSGTVDADISEFTAFPEEDIVRYTFTVTVDDDMDGTVIVSIPANVLIDASGNKNEASNIYTVIVDTTPPEYDSSVTTDANTITITADKLLVGTADAADFTVSDNTTLENTVSNVTVSGGVIILTVETSMMSGDEPIVSYEYDTMTDDIITDAGGNELAAFMDRGVTDILSTLPLTVSVAGSVLDGSITTSDTVSYTVTFSKVVTDFDKNDITLSGTASGGTPVLSNFAGSGAVYTFDVEADSDGTLTVLVPAAMATDAQNRDNSESNEYTVTFNIVVRIATFVDTIGSTSPNPGSGNGEFDIPYGIATTPMSILVTDLRNERVQIFDLDGDHIRTFGGFTQIRGVTATSTNILVVDGGNNRVQIFDLDGNSLSSFGGGGSDPGRFNIPGGITTNSTHILVVDASNNRVQVFDLEYNYVGQFGSSSPNSGSDNGQFDTPREITTNSTHILVADRNNHRIQVFDLDGNYVSQIGGSGSGSGDGQFSKPSGVAVTPTHILVADDLNHRVQVFDLDGNYVSQFGGMGAGDHQFNRPIGITTNSTHMLVTDSRNHRIQIFDLAPTVLITAATPNGLTHNSDTISYTVTFSENVTGFVEADIAVSGTAFVGTPATTNFAGSEDTYTFDVAATSDGTVHQ